MVSVARAQRFDRVRYVRFSSSVRPDVTRDNYAAWLTMLYHNLEKGLSLPDPRPGFGAAAVGRLIENVEHYVSLFGEDELTGFAVAALEKYQQFNRSCGLQLSEIPHHADIDRLLELSHPREGGTRRINRSMVRQAVSGVSMEFFTSRSSVRRFSDEPVPLEDIDFAARAAAKSPAVCNRQFGRIRVTQDRDVIDRALQLQGGARGFGTSVPALAVITTTVRAYWNAAERMQPWTDGGMFAMSFILGLHARGLGACCLNWSKLPRDDREFRRVFRIDDHEVIVMLVAFGVLPDGEFNVARSPRLRRADMVTALETR